jgi:ribose-phosphate pyrophosphokinase
MKSPIIFSTATSLRLAESIAAYNHQSPGNIYHHQFPSGEWYCQLKENVRGADVFLIQPVIKPVNDNLMQLLIMADACRRASAGSITAVIPYLGYSRQDRKDKSRVPISAKLVMDLIQAAGINRVLTMDLHAAQIQGFTNLPFDHLYFRPALINALKSEKVDVVVAPDIGAIKRADEYSRRMKVGFAMIAKRRINDTTVEITQFIGDVKDKNVLIVDDLTESAGTLVEAAKECRTQGAAKVFCAVTHNCLTDLGHTRLGEARKTGLIDMFLASTSTGWPTYADDVVKFVDIAPMLGDAIMKIHNNESISELFE